LTPEEIDKYKNIKPYNRPVVVEPRRENEEVEVMRETKITKEQLVNEIKKHGLSPETNKLIAEKYGLPVTSVSARVAQYKIKELLQEFGVVKAASEETKQVEKPESVNAAIKFYIASKLENADQVKKVASILKRIGWHHTYDWTKHCSVRGQGTDRIKEVAAMELKGVVDADTVIILLPGGRGTHAELGIANGLNKKVILWSQNSEPFTDGEETCAFYWNENVTRVSGDLLSLLDTCLEMGQKGA
jgi:nucleoside 2-deoxyribosyltransferase